MQFSHDAPRCKRCNDLLTSASTGVTSPRYRCSRCYFVGCPVDVARASFPDGRRSPSSSPWGARRSLSPAKEKVKSPSPPPLLIIALPSEEELRDKIVTEEAEKRAEVVTQLCWGVMRLRPSTTQTVVATFSPPPLSPLRGGIGIPPKVYSPTLTAPAAQEKDEFRQVQPIIAPAWLTEPPVVYSFSEGGTRARSVDATVAHLRATLTNEKALAGGAQTELLALRREKEYVDAENATLRALVRDFQMAARVPVRREAMETLENEKTELSALRTAKGLVDAENEKLRASASAREEEIKGLFPALKAAKADVDAENEKLTAAAHARDTG